MTEDMRAREIYNRPYTAETQEVLRKFFSEVLIGDTVEFHIKHSSEQDYSVTGLILDLFATVLGVLNVQRLERIAKGEQITEREPMEIGILVQLSNPSLAPNALGIEAVNYGDIQKYTILSQASFSVKPISVAQKTNQ